MCKETTIHCVCGAALAPIITECAAVREKYHAYLATEEAERLDDQAADEAKRTEWAEAARKNREDKKLKDEVKYAKYGLFKTAKKKDDEVGKGRNPEDGATDDEEDQAKCAKYGLFKNPKKRERTEFEIVGKHQKHLAQKITLFCEKEKREQVAKEASNSTGHRGCMYPYGRVYGTEEERREYEQRDMYRERLRQKRVRENEERSGVRRVEHMIERAKMWDEEMTARGKKRVEGLMEKEEEKERLIVKKLMAEERQRMGELVEEDGQRMDELIE